MEISFDPVKRASNLSKHGFDLADAGEVLRGDCLEFPDESVAYGEDRWIAIGLLGVDVVVCVWADWPDDVQRIISLRKAKKDEREEYFQARAH